MRRAKGNGILTLTVIVTTMIFAGIAPDATAQGKRQSRECTIEDVAIYHDRVVIQCDVKGGKKGAAKFYAVEVAAPISSMVLQLGLASLKRKVKIFYINDKSLNPAGCDPANCRRLEGIVAVDR